jgi:ATP-dependent DNA helicase DinG
MPATHLDDELKSHIQDAYRTWLASRDFAPRRGQREMIAAIARVLTAADAPRVAAIEAGTGTGKTAAYCLAAIPVAAALDKRLVIATATVALQEQITEKDLPDLALHAGLEFEFTLAKGRQRYVCLKRLDDRIREAGQEDLALFESVSDVAAATFGDMLSAFASRAWNGELDTWEPGVDEEDWRIVTTDHRGCTRDQCGFFRQCPFFKARAGLDKADVVIANLDLVLDLALGGGAVLPEPEDTIYVLDEAHHLPAKTAQHFTLRNRLRATVQWLDQVNAGLGTLAQRVGRPSELMAHVEAVAEASGTVVIEVNALIDVVAGLDFEPKDDERSQHRFSLGRVPVPIAEVAREAASAMQPVWQRLESVHGLLQEVVDGDREWSAGHEAEDWLGVFGGHAARAAGIHALFDDVSDANADASAPEDAPLRARWAARLTFDVGEDFELTSAPLETGALLEDALWSRAYGVICTSATLTGLSRFDRFAERSGLPDGALTERIASPFRYPEIAALAVPSMDSDPRNAAAHTEEVTRILPELLAQERSALVLFTSWRQLKDVVRALPESLDGHLRVQGSGSKQALLDNHRRAIDAGENSYLIGVASFAEGVDLPDDYCRHVIIVKLPFAVPDDPLDAAAAEHLEAQGRNPFFEISLPEASMRLVQACGRLIRHEKDHGRVTLLDRRVLTQRYGASLLDALPPFRREFG